MYQVLITCSTVVTYLRRCKSQTYVNVLIPEILREVSQEMSKVQKKETESEIQRWKKLKSNYSYHISKIQNAVIGYVGGYFLKIAKQFDSVEALAKSAVSNAEEYLVHVLRKDMPCKSFDDLRYNLYHHSKPMSFRDLPPTSATIKLYILRAYYVTYQQLTCLNAQSLKLDLSLFGYALDDDVLVTQRVFILQPAVNELVPVTAKLALEKLVAV
ncbi:hypothetical protein FQR65_LT11462 [Abscondita terminalis]|nr:hypothetical protein FQR65_LT11462 [Abscondita terminalis]